MTGPLERYLDDLFAELSDRLRGDRRAARRLLDETADHLHAATVALQAHGMSRIEAETEAVRRFGPPGPLVAAQRRRSLRRLAADSARTLVLLAGWGLVAVGISGALAAALTAAFGSSFVGGLPQTYPASVCRHFLALHPAAGSCARAAVLENSQDAVSLRLLAGVVGVLLVAGYAFVLRSKRASVLPAGLADGAGAVAFATATVLLSARSVALAMRPGGDGAGFYLSGALAALVGAAVFGVRAVRGVAHRRSAVG